MTAPLIFPAGLTGEGGPAGDPTSAPGNAGAPPAGCTLDGSTRPAHTLRFTVWGVPVPQGSHKGFVVNGRVVITQANSKTKPWRQEIVSAALDALRSGSDPQSIYVETGFPFGTGPVEVQVTFVMPRPKAHYRTGRYADLLRPAAPRFCATPPDTDKLQRSLGDALVTAGVVKDDAQIAVWQAAKVYASPGEKPGVHVLVKAAS